MTLNSSGVYIYRAISIVAYRGMSSTVSRCRAEKIPCRHPNDNRGTAVLSQKLVFALPGNPVSAFVTSTLLVLPAIRRLSGVHCLECRREKIPARLSHGLPLDPERPEYHRASVVWHERGYFEATTTGIQASSRLQRYYWMRRGYTS
jgi:molybdopterin biosynthesis enzyme